MSNPTVTKKRNTVFNLGELFSGPGGLALGAIRSRVETETRTFSIKHKWANDIDEDTCKTYRNNICPNNGVSVLCEDVRKLKLGTLDEVDALAFGFPCNDFSVVGEQNGFDGTFGPLYSYCVKAVKKFQPKFFVAENVGGIRSANEGTALNIILTAFEKAGYTVVPHYYKFEQYGVPQTRHRVIIVGIRNDLDVNYKVPAPTHLKPITSESAIETPPIPADAFNHDYIRQSHTVVERLKHIKAGENAFNADIPIDLQLNVKSATMSMIYKRLDPKKPAYTITGSGGGGTHVYHWKENRALTNRERARLQSFPDDFKFEGSKESVRKQVGMAIPPTAAEVIFTSILKSFAGIEYASVAQNIELQATLELT